jgi:hypothetical protein
MVKFCHIAPTKFLYLTASNQAHLLLAHLVESDPAYRNYYQNLDDGKVKILDNSAFEMYKQGKPMYPSNKLIRMGKAVGADYVVMSDYPNEPGSKTIRAAKQLAPEFREAGFKTFFVPQSEIGDLDDYVQTFEWALESDLVDMIGVSILGVPNAYGVEKDNKLQRYLSRYHLMKYLRSRNLLSKYVDGQRKRLHFLGMVDGPNEIEQVKEFHKYIYSWDSSAGVWAGLNGLSFDRSPTGLINGKFEKEVDFGLQQASDQNVALAVRNINYINSLVDTESVLELTNEMVAK